MGMKNPVHPGELVRANLEELGLSVADAAKGLAITRQQLHNVIAGRSAVSPEMAVRFEKGFGGSADMWLRMQAAFDLAEVRRREGEIAVERLGPARGG
jgi:antitoxin HigA-1